MLEWIALSYTIPKKKYKILFDGFSILTFFEKNQEIN